MVKRSIVQDTRNKNFGIRNGNFEKNAVVKNQGTKQRVQRIIGDCWQWETNGQCVKGDNCSFRHDTNKRENVTPSNPSPNSFMRQSERKSSRTRSPRSRSPSSRTSRWLCKDYLRGTCNQGHDRSGQPDKKSDKKLGRWSSQRRSSNARQLGCVFEDIMPPKSVLRKCTDMPKPIQRVKFTKATARHTKIRDPNPSLGYICPSEPMSVVPTLQNWRIGLKRRQSGKSKVPAKQRGSWPKVC